MVDPPAPGPQGPSDSLQGSTHRKELYYSHIVSIFESGDARVLFRPCNVSQRYNDLLDIFRFTGDLFSSLWKQKVAIVSWGSEKFQKTSFAIDSDLIMAHPVHSLEDGDSRMNGHSIQMVVQPAILAYGNEEGKNYEEFKVWAKAVVWLSS